MSTEQEQRRDAIEGLTAGIARVKKDLAAQIWQLKKHAKAAIDEHHQIIKQHRSALKPAKRTKRAKK